MVTFTEVVMIWKQKGKKVEWYSELQRAFRAFRAFSIHISPFSKHLGFPWYDYAFASVNLQRFTLFTFQGAQEKGVQPHSEGGLWQTVGFLHLLIQDEDIFTV